jgi:hypothetical protein
MATVTPGITFISGETVTPAKLNAAATPTVVVADNEVTTAKILDANVTTAKIADASVTAAKLASNAVETAKIADDAVTNDKLSLTANAGEIKKALNADNAPPIFACRAWVNFDGKRDSSGATTTANTARFIRASGNVSSVTKTGTGTFEIVFSTAMPDDNYVATGACDRDGSGIGGTLSVEEGTIFSTGVTVRTARFATTSSAISNAENIHVAIFR